MELKILPEDRKGAVPCDGMDCLVARAAKRILGKPCFVGPTRLYTFKTKAEAIRVWEAAKCEVAKWERLPHPEEVYDIDERGQGIIILFDLQEGAVIDTTLTIKEIFNERRTT